MITEIIEFAGFDGHLVPICISARNSRLHGDGCFDLLDKLELVSLLFQQGLNQSTSFNSGTTRIISVFFVTGVTF